MIISVCRETQAGERRVALVPDLVPKLARGGVAVHVEPGAGEAAGFPDAAYYDKGANLDAEALQKGDMVVKVQAPSREETARLKEGAALVGLLAPYTNAEGIQALADRRITAFALELMPRITRAQPMDALSAMSTVAGYKAVLIAANHL